MKTIRFILVAIMMICSIVSCYTQGRGKITDNAFQTLLDRFKTVTLPFNYKKATYPISSMTKGEAIRFLHKTEEDLYTMEIDYDYDTDAIIGYYKEEHTAGCDFKYKLNDSIYILCTREGKRGDSSIVYLNSFSLHGSRINKCMVGERFTSDSDWISFVLLDKTHIRIFYYEDDNTRAEEGFHSTVYSVNYEITGDGRFIENDKSAKIYLKKYAHSYCSFAYSGKSKMEEDDPMNEYDY